MTNDYRARLHRVGLDARINPVPSSNIRPTMIRFSVALIVLLSPLALCAEDAKSVKFTSKAGKFSVTLPEKPSEKTQTIKSDVGELEMHMFIVASTEQVYLLTYNDYPGDSLDEEAHKVLDKVIEGNQKSLKGKVTMDEKITIGKKKYPGRDIRIEQADKKQVYRAKVFLAGNRLYQVVALGPDEFVKSKSVEEYLKSFAINE